MSDPCPECVDMSAGYVCITCGRKNAESDFTYQWYAVTVRITGTEPVVRYRHGPRKGEPKGTAWNKTLYSSPTHYYNYNVQGIRNEAACKSLVEESFAKMVKEFESLGYTEVRLTVTAVGVYL